MGSSGNRVYALDPADGSQKRVFASGAVYSSPAIGSDGTVYVGSDYGKVYAVNPGDGSTKWTFAAGRRAQPCSDVLGGHPALP